MWPRIEVIRIDKGSRLRFSRTELQHLLISVGVLVAAFTIWLLRTAMPLEFSLLAALLAVGTGFVLHEMAHKFMAQRFRCWAEYRYFPFGLLLTLISSVAGFLVAAPGAVHVAGVASRRENGLISLLGPVTNLGTGAILLPLGVLTGGLVSSLLLFAAYINLFLGVFNILPVPPLDGSKIYRWNLPLYILTFAALVGLLALTYLIMTGYIAL